MHRITGTEYQILDLLRGKTEKYGLEMVKESSSLKRGTIYVTLQRMTEKGLVTSRQEERPDDPGLPLRMYKITGHGQQVLNAQDAFNSVMAEDFVLGGATRQ